MKFFALLAFALLTFTLLPSCTEEIEIRLRDGDVRLVVFGGIGIDTMVHTVVLSRTTSYFEDSKEPLYVEGATVTITEFNENMQLTGRVFQLLENPDSIGHYQTTPDVFGIQGFTYRLDILLSEAIGGYSRYSAYAFFPFIADQIDSLHAIHARDMLLAGLLGFDPFDTVGGRQTGWNLLLFAEDPPDRVSYYAFITSLNGVALNDTLTRFLLLDNTMIDRDTINAAFPIAFFRDVQFGGRDTINNGDTLGLEIRSISADFYRWIFEFRSIYSGQNPMFGGAPANVRGNVRNMGRGLDAIGYFWAHGSRRAYVVVGENN
ncbi:MAG: DUF4249 domain-containing protein [Bacteroidales bacterium]|nr:DUF4249 domain-containing protein [Bacteroidales bacterium]